MLKLVADQEPTVVNAVGFLDNIVKDNVTASPSKLQLDVFIPKLKEFLRVVHPMKRSFLISWISFLDSVPELNLVVHLPSLVDGLFNYISDPSKEIKAAAASTLSEFLLEIHTARGSLDVVFISKLLSNDKAFSADDATRITAFKWLKTFLELFSSGPMIEQFPSILSAVLANASHPNKDVRAAAMETDAALCGAGGKKDDIWKKIDAQALLSSILPEANSNEEPSRLLAWKWILFLLSKSQQQVLSSSPSLIPSLLDSIGDGSEALVSQALDVISSLASCSQDQFRQVLLLLIDRFRGGEAGVALLQRVGALTIRRLVKRLGGVQVLSELAVIVDDEKNLAFASMFVQALNLLLLTSPELASVRELLKDTKRPPESIALFDTLFPTWCHSCGAAISLCFLSAKFQLSHSLIESFANMNVGAEVLLQLDRLVSLIETPAFTFLRLTLLRPRAHPELLQSLLALLALLPQSNSWRTLNARLSSIPIQALLSLDQNGSSASPSLFHEDYSVHLELFQARQRRHESFQLSDGDPSAAHDGAQLLIAEEEVKKRFGLKVSDKPPQESQDIN